MGRLHGAQPVRLWRQALWCGLLSCLLDGRVASGSGPAEDCRASLQALDSCGVRIQAQTACSSVALLNSTLGRAILGCTGSLGDCQAKCLDSLGMVGLPVNSSTAGCTIQQQLMKQYSGSPDLVFSFVSDPSTGLKKPMPLPSALVANAAIPSFSFFGDYQRCLYGDEMQYCLVEGAISMGPMSLSALMGLCRPSTCSQADIHENAGSLVGQAGMDNYRVSCRKKNDPDPQVDWSAGKVAALAFFVGILALVIGSTAWEFHKERHSILGNDGSAERGSAMLAFVQAWSLARNLASFLRTRPDDAELSMGVLDGLRVLSTFWVILGHTVIWPMLTIQYANSGMVLPPYGRLTETWFQVVPGGYFAVDTFFWLSGFLGARALHARVQKSPRLLSPTGFCFRLYPAALLNRWLRLSLVYAVILLFTQTWYRELGKGGLLWNAGTSMGRGGCVSSIDNPTCKKYWWAQLLYINNLVPTHSNAMGGPGCLAWTWYLACDMQLFLILPFLVLVRERLGKALAWALLLALAAASVAANGWLIWQRKLVTDPVLGNMGGGHFMEDVYEVSWMRAQPYLIGVGAAWLLERLAPGGGAARAKQPGSGGGDGIEEVPAALLPAEAAGGSGDQELGVQAPARRPERRGGSGPEPLLGGPPPRRRGGAGGGGRRIGAPLALGLQVLSFAAMCSVVFLPVTRYRCSSLQACTQVDTSPWSEGANALYGAVNHAVWGLGLGCLMLLCFLRAPGTWWVNCFLGAPFWQAPMKLTYSAYLLHPLVLVFFYCQHDASLQYLDVALFANFVTCTVVVFLLALLVWLTVEKPTANLSAHMLGSLTGDRRAVLAGSSQGGA